MLCWVLIWCGVCLVFELGMFDWGFFGFWIILVFLFFDCFLIAVRIGYYKNFSWRFICCWRCTGNPLQSQLFYFFSFQLVLDLSRLWSKCCNSSTSGHLIGSKIVLIIYVVVSINYCVLDLCRIGIHSRKFWELVGENVVWMEVMHVTIFVI